MPQFQSAVADNIVAAMNPFLAGYIMAIYFTETGDTDQPDSEAEMDEGSIQRAVDDCLAFQALYAFDLGNATSRVGYDEGRAGHDFWLTRNGHGAGYWDREELGDRLGETLTAAAKAFGGCSGYKGDDGRLYLA